MIHKRVGILGAGQLGRMLGLAAIPLGIDCEFLDPGADAPAGRVGKVHRAALTDSTAIARLALETGLVTPEIENVSLEALRVAARQCPVHPTPAVVGAAQDRLSEKQLFADFGIPTAPYVAIETSDDLAQVSEAIEWPVVLKSRRMGYDGRGQRIVASDTELRDAWADLGSVPSIAEGWVEFRREVSLIAVRGADNEQGFYPLCENTHKEGILRESIAPCSDRSMQAQAERWLAAIMERFDYRGVLTVEFFDTAQGLVANEMAPRVHNSGHWTIEGAETSQFENHLRAVTGLPLGTTSVRAHAAMLNLIGTMPAAETILAEPGVHLHDYGKAPRPGRKLGHCTIVDSSRRRLISRLAGLKTAISNENS